MTSGFSRSRSQYHSSVRVSPWWVNAVGCFAALGGCGAMGIPLQVMPIYSLGDLVPEIHPDAYIHPDAVVIGQVMIGAEASIWPGAVLRGDNGRIEIGARTSVQDGSVIHA